VEAKLDMPTNEEKIAQIDTALRRRVRLPLLNKIACK
jgi:hypothetical protein